MRLKRKETYWMAEANMFESKIEPIRVERITTGATWYRVNIVFTDNNGNLRKDTILLEKKGSVMSDVVSGYHNKRIFTSNNGACKWVISELNRHIDHLKEEQRRFKSRIKYEKEEEK